MLQQYRTGTKKAARCPQPHQPGCTLYVRAIPSDCTAKMLFDTFKVAGMLRYEKSFGTCISIQKMKTPPTSKASPFTQYAYVEFTKQSGLQYCLAKENRESFSITTLSAGECRLNVEGRGTANDADSSGRSSGSVGSSAQFVEKAVAAVAASVVKTSAPPQSAPAWPSASSPLPSSSEYEWQSVGGEPSSGGGGSSGGVANAGSNSNVAHTASSHTAAARRQDPTDGKMYTREAFFKCYGEYRQWNEAGTEHTDWVCKCSFANFKSRASCKNCGLSRSSKQAAGGLPPHASTAASGPKTAAPKAAAARRAPLAARQQPPQQTLQSKTKKKKKAKTETSSGVPVDVSCKDLKTLLKEHGWELVASKRKSSTQVYSLKRAGRTEKVSILWSDMDSQGNRSKIRKYEEVMEKSGILN